MSIDPNAEAAVHHLVETDKEFQSAVKIAAILALRKLTYWMKNGTPDQQVAISSKFLPIWVKALSGDDGDEQTRKMKSEVQTMLSEMIGGNLPSDDSDDDDSEDNA